MPFLLSASIAGGAVALISNGITTYKVYTHFKHCEDSKIPRGSLAICLVLDLLSAAILITAAARSDKFDEVTIMVFRCLMIFSTSFCAALDVEVLRHALTRYYEKSILRYTPILFEGLSGLCCIIALVLQVRPDSPKLQASVWILFFFVYFLQYLYLAYFSARYLLEQKEMYRAKAEVEEKRNYYAWSAGVQFLVYYTIFSAASLVFSIFSAILTRMSYIHPVVTYAPLSFVVLSSLVRASFAASTFLFKPIYSRIIRCINRKHLPPSSLEKSKSSQQTNQEVHQIQELYERR